MKIRKAIIFLAAPFLILFSGPKQKQQQQKENGPEIEIKIL